MGIYLPTVGAFLPAAVPQCTVWSMWAVKWSDCCSFGIAAAQALANALLFCQSACKITVFQL